ncbi:NAD(P)-dependent alcohol dehydrogenase [Actinoplanes sp. NPDC051494]|uniref:NAD(P)-dependent alcohol dehydrogenase n=1 Tax=Actinoplanes sp. NPDC051494 TaxID=3363907 RepID=UPI003794ED70
MRQTSGYALLEPGQELRPWQFERRDLRPDDIAVTVTHCGLCHSDIHAVDGASGLLVPGHEFVGTVAEVGAAVTRFAVGDSVAVGNIVDSCGVCDYCKAGQQNYCSEFPVTTYGGSDYHDGTTTRGAYSREYVLREDFAYHLPAGLDPAGAAPLMCAGATVWEPLVRWDVGPGTLVGVVGLGGLGHLAVKFAKALGARVAVFTTTAAKEQAALELGADEVIVSRDEAAMTAQNGRFAFILDTASGAHDPAPYLRALALDGTLCVLGIPQKWTVDPMSLLIGRKSFAASGSAGLPQTQRMLDFCAEHGITADVEVVGLSEVNAAMDRLRRNDVRYRFVLDVTR